MQRDLKCYLDSGIQQGQQSTRIHNKVVKIRNNEKWMLDYIAFSAKFEDELVETRVIAHAKGLQDGHSKGLKEVFSSGRHSMLKEIIKTNLDNNVPIKDIANFAGENIENIKSIIDDI